MQQLSIRHFKSISSVLIIFVLLVLSGCSPHPGAGKWQADGNNAENIAIINVLFEGTADFYKVGQDESIRRCFWSAVARQTMKMQCVYSDDTNKKVSYQFEVIDKGHAELSQNGQLIGRFTLKKPDKEASFF